MKTLIKSLAFACLSFSLVSTSFGANEEKKAAKEAEKAAEKSAEMNHVALKDGKVWVMKDGQTMELKEEVTLNDGTKVMTDGSYMDKGKDKKMLKEGEAITWEGKVKDHAKIMKAIEKDKEKTAEKAVEKPIEDKK